MTLDLASLKFEILMLSSNGYFRFSTISALISEQIRYLKQKLQSRTGWKIVEKRQTLLHDTRFQIFHTATKIKIKEKYLH